MHISRTVSCLILSSLSLALSPAAWCGDCEPDCTGQPATDMDGDGLTACAEDFFDTSDSKADTDGDGMPDGWEARYCGVLNGAQPNDMVNNPDGDAFTNWEEFRRGGDPVDPLSPMPTYFVSPDGLDLPISGTELAPFRTINYALDSIEMKGGGPAAIVLASTDAYVENITLLPGILLRSFDFEAVVQGTIIGAEGCELYKIGLRPPNGGDALRITDASMVLNSCSIQGGPARSATGIVIEGSHAADVLIRDCYFDTLSIGIDVEAGLPKLARTYFVNHSSNAILVRCDGDVDAFSQAPADDPRTGFNYFAPTIDGIAIINDCTEPLHLRRNEWGFNTPRPELIAARIDGQADTTGFLNFQAVNNSNYLVAHVFQAGTVDTPLPGAVVKVRGLTATADADGVARFEALATGAATIQVTADGHQSQTRDSAINNEVFGNVRLFFMETGEDGGEGEGAEDGEGDGGELPEGCQGPEESKGSNHAGQAVMGGLILLVLAASSRGLSARK